jgi:putative membrane protein insertion efficiency factor
MFKESIVNLITGYQRVVSPVLGNNCRFYPSCSHYTKEAISTFGLIKGAWISMKRLLKCHPFHPGGIDKMERNK